MTHNFEEGAFIQKQSYPTSSSKLKNKLRKNIECKKASSSSTQRACDESLNILDPCTQLSKVFQSSLC